MKIPHALPFWLVVVGKVLQPIIAHLMVIAAILTIFEQLPNQADEYLPKAYYKTPIHRPMSSS